MFGESPGKLLFLIVVIAVVWYGSKYVSRVEAVRRHAREEKARRQQQRMAPRAVEDLVKCPRCGAFVAAGGAAKCGKQECPWG